MNSKLFILCLLSLFTCLALVSAAATFSVSPTSFTFSQSINSSTFVVTNLNQSSLINMVFDSVLINGELNPVSFSINGNPNDINTTSTFTLVPSSPIDFSNFRLGKTYSNSFLVKNAQNTSDTQSVGLTVVKAYCSGQESNNLSITEVSLNNKGGGDDTSWQPLDDISLKITVENINIDTDNKVDTTVKVGLYDSKGVEKLGLDTFKLGKIGSSDKSTTFDFKVPTDLDDGTYSLYVKAYKSGSESSVCTSTSPDLNNKYYQTINVERESDSDKQVMFDTITPQTVPIQCGAEQIIKTKIANIGDTDQDKVKTTIYNKELGVNLYKITSGLNVGDDEVDLEFSFDIPQNATEKSYTFELRNLYNFNDDYDETDNKAYDDSSETSYFSFNVAGCVRPVLEAAIVQEVVGPESANAGDTITVKLTIKNNGDTAATYTPLLMGADSFAVATQFPQVIIDAGQSKQVSATLKINDDASGDYTYLIKEANTKFKEVSSIPISIQGKTGIFSGLGSSNLLNSITSNWLIWVIVLINVVLIVLIVVIAVRIARK